MSDKPLTRQQKWRKANPKRYRAHLAVKNALSRGELTRKPCEFCGEVKSEGHHPDYERPCDVVWLCRKCHCQLHAQERRAA